MSGRSRAGQLHQVVAGPADEDETSVEPGPARLARRHLRIPGDLVDERVVGGPHELQTRDGHLYQLPLDALKEVLERRRRTAASFSKGRRGIGRVALAEGLDGAHDLGLALGVLAQHERLLLGDVGTRLRPVELEDALGEVGGGHRRRRSALGCRVLHAGVHQGEQEGVLVGGRGAALIDEGE